MKTLSILLTLLALPLAAATINVADHGILPTPECDASPLIEKLLGELKGQSGITLHFPKGTYHFYQPHAAKRERYISNHDQTNPRTIAIPIEHFTDLTLDGSGSEFIIHGRMIEISAIHCTNLTLKNFTFDFQQPQITQINIQSVNPEEKSFTFTLIPGTHYTLEGTRLTPGRDGWKNQPTFGMLYDSQKRNVPNTANRGFNLKDVQLISENHFKASNVGNAHLLAPGMMYAARTGVRACPGIALDQCTDTKLENITIHYSDGMALIAQLCENITLDRFRVALRSGGPRASTTQADATHFSGCKGTILSQNGHYENMMDDAINVHGTYLKITAILSDRTLRARYLHGQSWGFKWGESGDSVQILNPKTMETTGAPGTITAIATTGKPIDHGSHEFEITFEKPFTAQIGHTLENLTWTPAVTFRNNTIRSNRARGTLFTTPRPILIEGNTFFDHSAGPAIFISGDCNSWYESGAVRDVTIRRNRFISPPTPFSRAAIHISPEIPDLKNQKKYYHSNITIEDNTFDLFDQPLLYAKSTDGITFKNNTILNPATQPHFIFDRSANITLTGNTFPRPLNPAKDIRLSDSPMPAID